MRGRVIIGVVLVALLIGAGVAYALLAPPAHLDAYGDGPDDLGDFRRSVETLGFNTAAIGVSPHVLSSLGRPDRILVISAGVERPYRPGEIRALESFVNAGGSLVVADDFGFANAVGDKFGVNFDKLRLFDADYELNQSLVRVRAEFQREAYPLVLNVPTALSVRNPDATVLAVSSEGGYLDSPPGNFVKDDGDTQGAMIVAVVVPRGAGQAVFIGDPAPFTNAMLPHGSNRDFLLDLVASLLPPDGGTVLFDESRHSTNLVAAAAGQGLEVLVVATHEAWLAWLVLPSLAIVAAVWLRLRHKEAHLGHHVGHLDDRVRPSASPPMERLRLLARTRIVSAHGIDPNASPEAFREAAQDELIGRLAAGDDLNITEVLDDLLARLDRYGRRDAGRREL